MKGFNIYGFCMIMAAALALPAAADDAAGDWSRSMGYSSPSQQAVDFNKAQAEYLLREGALPGSTVINQNGDSFSETHCEVAGACQNGGTAQNINGYSSITVEGSTEVGVGVDINTDDTQQGATATSAVADDIGTIEIN